MDEKRAIQAVNNLMNMRGYTEMNMRQVTAQKSVSDASFSQGVQQYAFNIGGNYGYIPSKSYFRVGIELTKVNPAAPGDLLDFTAADVAAIADNPVACLYNNAYFKMGSADVSTATNFLPQASQASVRITKSGAWLDSVGDAYGFNDVKLDPTYVGKNLDIVAKNNKSSRVYAGKNKQFILWNPPLGIIDKEDLILGAGDYRIDMSPVSNVTDAIVTLSGAIPANTQYGARITSVEYYACVVRVTEPLPKSLDLVLNEHMPYVKTIPEGKTANLDFSVPSSCKSMSIFFQNGDAGTNGSLVGTSTVPRATEFTVRDGGTFNIERDLKSIQIAYANTVKPSTRFDSSRDELQQRYIDTHINTGLLLNGSGPESYQAWKNRGLLLFYTFERDANDRSTQVQIQVDSNVDFPANTNLFVVAHYTRVVNIQSESGFITSVNAINA